MLSIKKFCSLFIAHSELEFERSLSFALISSTKFYELLVIASRKLLIAGCWLLNESSCLMLLALSAHLNLTALWCLFFSNIRLIITILLTFLKKLFSFEIRFSTRSSVLCVVRVIERRKSEKRLNKNKKRQTSFTCLSFIIFSNERLNTV